MLEDMVHTVLRIYVFVLSEDAMAVVCDNYILILVGFFLLLYSIKHSFTSLILRFSHLYTTHNRAT